MKIFGCGIDIEEINRFKKHLQTHISLSPLIKDVFTNQEIKINLSFNKSICFPLGFSCKEAVFKALGVSWTNSPILWKEIELLFLKKDNLTQHNIRLSGYAKKLFLSQNCNKIDSSFEYNNDFVMFQVVLLK
ncbi:MAG: 4'-phosphopantetheinyl transferase superfamily protein [Bacteroidota bacterium]